MFVSLQALKKELAKQKLEAQKAWYRFEKAEEGKNVAPESKPDWKAEKANPAVEAKPCHSCIVDFYDLYGRQIWDCQTDWIVSASGSPRRHMLSKKISQWTSMTPCVPGSTGFNTWQVPSPTGDGICDPGQLACPLEEEFPQTLPSQQPANFCMRWNLRNWMQLKHVQWRIWRKKLPRLWSRRMKQMMWSRNWR